MFLPKNENPITVINAANIRPLILNLYFLNRYRLKKLIKETLIRVDPIPPTDKKSVINIVGESNMVKNGGAASIGVDYYRLGKQTAIMADKILKGEAKTDEIPIETLEDLDVYINSKTLKDLGIDVPSDLTVTDMAE